MKLLPVIGTTLLLSVASLNFAASLTSLKKSEAMGTLRDKTMTTISAAALNGKIIPNSFTGYFGKDGKMNGGFVNKPEDAPQNDQGTWKVREDGKVCVVWEHWFNSKEQCVYLYKLSNGLLIINTDRGFESLVLTADLKTGNHTQTQTQTQ
jgi:hypothetical protein